MPVAGNIDDRPPQLHRGFMYNKENVRPRREPMTDLEGNELLDKDGKPRWDWEVGC